MGLRPINREVDRARTEAAARGQCGQKNVEPYVIDAGPNGGVIMLLGDQSEREMRRAGIAFGSVACAVLGVVIILPPWTLAAAVEHAPSPSMPNAPALGPLGRRARRALVRLSTDYV
jgi:hypothetical protein